MLARVRCGRKFNFFVERTSGDGPALFEDDLLFWTYFVGRRDPLSTLQKRQGAPRDRSPFINRTDTSTSILDK